MQRLMDIDIVQVSRKNKEARIAMIRVEKDAGNGPRLVIIHYMPTGSVPRPLEIQVPTPFPYKHSQAVPWRYAFGIEQTSSGEINIAGVGGITGSGQIYALEDTRKEETLEQGSPSIAKKARVTEKGSEMERKEEHSEYELMDQLKQTPTNISLLSLLMNSESHRKVLIRVLNEANMDKNISVDKLEGIVGHIMANNYITFSNEEIPAEGRGHNRALNISVRCFDCFLTKVLIDNDSSLNVLPKATLERLPYDRNKMRNTYSCLLGRP
ncbi:hypothetical protein CR513_56208, partial [Mucuna pruriens]